MAGGNVNLSWAGNNIPFASPVSPTMPGAALFSNVDFAGGMVPGVGTPDAGGWANMLNFSGVPGSKSSSWLPDGLGWNMDTLKLGIGGLQTLGNLYMGSQALDLGRRQFNLQKDLANTNLANQIKSYNTRLSDRAYARAAFEEKPREEADRYIEANRLSR